MRFSRAVKLARLLSSSTSSRRPELEQRGQPVDPVSEVSSGRGDLGLQHVQDVRWRVVP